MSCGRCLAARLLRLARPLARAGWGAIRPRGWTATAWKRPAPRALAFARARADGELLQRIPQIPERSCGTYGSRRIHAEQVDPNGTHRVRCARKRVMHLMRQTGLVGCHRRGRRPRTTSRDRQATPAPDRVERSFAPAQIGGPNNLWVADITYARATRARSPMPSRNDGVTMIGMTSAVRPACGRGFAPRGRRRFCSDACRQAAWRHRHASPVGLVTVLPSRSAAGHVTAVEGIYECPLSWAPRCGRATKPRRGRRGDVRVPDVWCPPAGCTTLPPLPCLLLLDWSRRALSPCEEPVAVADLITHEGR